MISVTTKGLEADKAATSLNKDLDFEYWYEKNFLVGNASPRMDSMRRELRLVNSDASMRILNTE